MGNDGKTPEGFRRFFRLPGSHTPVEVEVEDEIRFHLEEKRARLVADGLTPEEAAREAGRRFGDVDEVRKEMESMTKVRRSRSNRRDLLGDLNQDVKFARRQLARSPLFTLVAVVTLGLGIGATTAIYSVVDGIMLKPLPFPEPQQLVSIWADYSRRGGPAQEWLSYPNFEDLTEQSEALLGAAVYGGGGPTLTGRGDPQPVRDAQISRGMFTEVLRANPAMGRHFDDSEHGAGGPRAVILSHGLWERAFGGDPAVLGQSISLNDQPHTVVGVMGPDFSPPFIPDAELWRPMQIDPANPPCGRGCAVLRAIGRMAESADVEILTAEATAIGSRLEREYPEDNTGVGYAVAPLREDLVAEASTALRVLLGAVAFVLIMACVNVANLMLGRATARRGEMAVRAALGAGGKRIIRQLLTESGLLALLGGGLGIAIGAWATGGLVSLAPAGTPRIQEVSMDLRVLAVMAIVTLTSGVVFGTLPALRAARRDVNADLREGGRGSGSGGPARLRSALVVTQVALALVLTAGAGLLIRSFDNLRSAELGFETEGVTTFFLGLPNSRYPDRDAVQSFYERLEERVSGLPGVAAVGSVSTLPLTGLDGDVNFNIEGRPLPEVGEELAVWFRRTTPGYHEAMGIDIVAGRGFQPSDDAESPRVVIVNETMAEQLFPERSPIGQRLNLGNPENPVWREIVGVARDVRNFGIRQDSRYALYAPFAQVPAGFMFLAVKSSLPTESVTPQIRLIIREADPSLAMARVQSMEDVVGASLAADRVTTLLLALFAGLALTLAVVGIYGVLSYSVTSRFPEMGLRIALGGSVRSVGAMIVGKSLSLVGLGIAVGLVGVVVVTRAMGALLYGVSPTDPVTLAAVVALLTMVGAVASIQPARRAGRVDPISVLKAE